MKQELCALIANYPTVTILGMGGLAVLCLFSVLGTVCFVGLFCILIRSVQKGWEEGWLQYEESAPRRRPRHRSPGPEQRSRTVPAHGSRGRAYQGNRAPSRR